jgi:hypothetical protein
MAQWGEVIEGMATGQQLQQAYELIKNGHKEHAASLLSVMLAADPCNADAWWLLALSASDAPTIQRALTKLLELRPDDMRARQLLDSIGVRHKRADARTAAVDLVRSQPPPPPLMEARLPRLRHREARRNQRPSRRLPGFLPAVLAAGLFGILGCAVLMMSLGIGVQWIGRRISEWQAPAAVHAGALVIEEQAALGDINALGNTGYTQYRSGVISSADQRHAYAFSGLAGDWVALEATTPDAALQLVLSLYDSDGRQVATSSDSAVALALPQDGSYRLVVSARAGVGIYNLTLRHD